MGYLMPTKQQFADVQDVTFFAAGSRAATVDSATVETDRGTACLTLDVTACTGSLDITIYTRKDSNASWRSAGTFTQATGVTAERKSITGLDREVKATATIVTGPSVFSLSGEIK